MAAQAVSRAMAVAQAQWRSMFMPRPYDARVADASYLRTTVRPSIATRGLLAYAA